MIEWGICMKGNEKYISDAVKKVIDSHTSDYIVRYVEIGVAEGRTFAGVCRVLNKYAQTWEAIGIDIEKGYSLNLTEFYKNTEEFGDKVTMLLTGSPKAIFDNFGKDMIDIALIDGDHQLFGVVNDFKAVDKCLSKGGVIIFHDTDISTQGLDAHKDQPDGIQVRKACELLGLLNGENHSYDLLLDFEGNRSEGGRGIIIVQKTE